MNSFFKSFMFFFKLMFQEKKYDVVFVSLNHFNRDKKGKNPFFKPFINTCEKHNLKYILFEETDLKGAYSIYPRDNSAIPLDFITLIQIFLRKLFSRNKDCKNYKDYHHREVIISKFLKFLFFRKFKSKVYVVLAHNNVTLWRTINPNAIIIDYQHGMIWNGHDSTLINNRAADVKTYNNIISMVYGKGFQDLLIEYDKTGFYNKKNVIPIGYYYFLPSYKVINNNKCILYTLQNVDMKSNEKYYRMVKKVILYNKDFFQKNGYKVLIKNHPRYNRDDKISFDEKLSFVHVIDDKTLVSEISEYFTIHITSKSTTAFDLALKGIPTIFIDMLDIRSPREIFFEQYKYPLNDFIIKEPLDLKDLLIKLESKDYFDKVSRQVYNWARNFYEDFDGNKFLDFINKKKYSNEY